MTTPRVQETTQPGRMVVDVPKKHFVGIQNAVRNHKVACGWMAGIVATGTVAYEGITHIPPAQAHVALVATAPLVQAPDGNGWLETATFEVTYTGDTPAPVSIGVQRDTTWSVAGRVKSDGPPRKIDVETNEIWSGADVVSVTGATQVGNVGADLGVMKQGDDKRVTITYQVDQSDAQRAATDRTWWTNYGFYDAADPVQARGVVTLGSNQQQTDNWTELQG